MKVVFDSLMKKHIQRGDFLTSQLKGYVEKALGVTEYAISGKRHTYIFSKPGAGKTFTVAQTAQQNNIELLKIQGASSLNAVANNLAFANYYSPPGEIVVWIDDCDGLFREAEGLGVMKGVLDEDRNVFSWNKNLTMQILTLERGNANQQKLAEALRAVQPAGSVGINIPTDRMRFIVTSNKELMSPNGNLNTQKKMDEAAIRDRVSYYPFNLTAGDSWGWLASIVLKSNALPISQRQARVLLYWMYTNWSHLAGNSMRSVLDMAAMMVNHPKDYISHWELQYLEG